MNLYEIRFAGDKTRHLFRNEMDLTQIAMILNSDIKFCKMGNRIIKIKEIVEVEASNIETENKEMYDRMKPNIPVIEFPTQQNGISINDIKASSRYDIEETAKKLSEKIKENKCWR